MRTRNTQGSTVNHTTPLPSWNGSMEKKYAPKQMEPLMCSEPRLKWQPEMESAPVPIYSPQRLSRSAPSTATCVLQHPPVPDMNGNATNQEGKPRENGHSEKGVRSHNRGRVLRNAKNLKIYPSGQFTCQGFKIKKRGSYEGPVWRKHAEELGIEGSLGNSLRTLWCNCNDLPFDEGLGCIFFKPI